MENNCTPPDCNPEVDHDGEMVDCLSKCTISSDDSDEIAKSIVESEEWPSYIEQLREAVDEDDDLACKTAFSGRYVAWGTRKLPSVNGFIHDVESDDSVKTNDVTGVKFVDSVTTKSASLPCNGTSVDISQCFDAKETVPRGDVEESESPMGPKSIVHLSPDGADKRFLNFRTSSPLQSGNYKIASGDMPSAVSAMPSGCRRLRAGLYCRSPYKQFIRVPAESPGHVTPHALPSLDEFVESSPSKENPRSPLFSSGKSVRDSSSNTPRKPRTPGTAASVFSLVTGQESVCSDISSPKSPQYTGEALEWSKDVEQFRAALSSGSSGDYDLAKSSFRINKSGSSFVALEHFFRADGPVKPEFVPELAPVPRVSPTSDVPVFPRRSVGLQSRESDSSTKDNGKKLLFKRLGRGAFGRVFGVQIKGRLVAVKDVRNVDDPAEKNAMHLVHRHVVRTLYLTQLETRRFLVVMEYGGPHTMQNLLDEGRLQLLDTLRYGKQIASALHYCHRRNILHLDVKPSNILIQDKECKLADFGSSAVRGTTPKVSGTVQYMAPESLCGQRPDYASDIYSLGVVLWQMHSGDRPFDGLHQHHIIFQVVREKRRPPFPEDTPKDFEQLVNRCWATRHQERPTIGAVVKDLNVLHKAHLLVRSGATQ